MFKKGRRLFTMTTFLLFLVALAHTAGTFSRPRDARATELLESMKAYRFELGLGMNPSIFDVQISLALTMTIFLVFLGILNLVLAGREDWIDAGILRFFAAANALCMWVLALLYLVYRIPPPLISFAVLGVLYTLSIRTTRGAEGTFSHSPRIS